MNQRPTYEPSRHFPQPQRLWDNAAQHATSLGCATCLELPLCGGVHTDAGVFDCSDLCSCKAKNKCDMVCRCNPAQFVARMREVGGLSFDNAPRVPARGLPDLPPVIPFVDHRYRRAALLDEPVVALSLYDVVNLATGEVRISSREALAHRFRIAERATVILSGVDKDGLIERWWELQNRPAVLAALAHLGVALITAPNYSVLTDVPRTDNLHAMKRILLSWTEMAAVGLRSALHVNGRTEHDYFRWANLISSRPEIEAIAFEFATGGGRGSRIDWHVTQLCALADRVKRPLALVIRGGGRKLHELRRSFARVSLIETDAFCRTLHRRRAYLTESGQVKWAKFPTPVGEAVDELLAHNVAVIRSAYEARIEATSPLTLPARAFPRRAAYRDGQPAQSCLLRQLDMAGQARSVPAEPQGIISTTKP